MLVTLRRYLDLILLAALGGLLVAVPQIDLVVTSLFYDPAAGFWLKNHWLARFIYDLVPWVSRAVLAGLLVFLVLARTARRHHPFFLAHRKTATYLLLVALIGPLFLVNSVFKDHWGRARPSQTVEFGGNQTFTTNACAAPIRPIRKAALPNRPPSASTTTVFLAAIEPCLLMASVRARIASRSVVLPLR